MGSSSPMETIFVGLDRTFPGHVSGNHEGLFVVISQAELKPPALEALSNSARALGFSAPATFSSQDQASPLTLVTLGTQMGPEELILTLESLDPLAIVTCDHASAKTLADAYRTQIKIEAPQKLLGRPLCCFEDFDSMISSNEGKQNAWKLLKSIARN